MDSDIDIARKSNKLLISEIATKRLGLSIDDLYTFVQDVVSGREGWVIRSNEDSFD